MEQILIEKILMVMARSDYDEIITHFTDPFNRDSDNDGLELMVMEINDYESNPNVVDSDGDGLTDGEEINDYDSNPILKDSDGDGLTDGRRSIIRRKLNPGNNDTDDDGIDDGAEINDYFTNATNSDSD